MALGAGSIAFVGFNADGGDGFAFIALEAIPSGTVIYFNDNEWNGSPIGAGGAFNTGESAITWTADSALAVGQIVEIRNFGLSPSASATNTGTVSTSGTNLGLAASGESIFAFIGSADSTPTAFLAAVTNNNGGFNGATTSGLLAGTGLTAGTNALVLPGTGGADVAVYDPTAGTSFTSRDAALSAFNNPSNWLTQDAAGDQSADSTVPDVPFLSNAPLSTASFSIGAAAPTLASFTVDIASKLEGATYVFTATLSAAATADTVVSLTASGATGDLVSTPASITILAGQTTGTASVTSIQDSVVEPDESFSLTATLGADSRQVTATILNDDVAPTNVFGGITILPMAPSLEGSVATPVATNSINAIRIGGYVTGNGAGGAESIAYSPTLARAFTTNPALDRIDMIDLSTPTAPALVGSIDLRATNPDFAYGEVNSVAVRGGLVAVAMQNADGGQAGLVSLYNGATGALIKSIAVGVQPDQLTFSPDGSLLLVANEAERFLAGPGGTVVNAPGTVSIISVPADASLATLRNTVGFSALDAFEAEIDALGIKTYDGGTVGGVVVPDSTVSQDLEPEYITVSPDGRTAYVTIQEANAVAVIDLTNAGADKPASLLPLGFVDFSLPGNQADFSDRDGAGGAPSINVHNAAIKSLLQPDAIASFAVGGSTYFITANEGDSRIVSGPTEITLNEARLSTLVPGAASDIARLNVDTVWSTPTDLYAFGGRGFSIFRQNADGTITKVEETGGDIEQIVAALPNASTVFNGENGGAFDTRSDNKGAEPEGVAVGVVDGVPYAFISLERLGGVMMWDVSNPADAKFVRYLAPTSSDSSPEVIKFIPADESPNGRALVLTANEVSGSVTVYEVSNLTRISAVQGSGAASPLVGQTVTIEAIVVGDFQNGDADTARNLGGFWVQEEAFDQDGNPLTSEGIFVAQGSLTTDVSLGDRVRITGVVAESFNNTELNASAISVVQAGAVADVNTLAVAVSLPAAGVQGTLTGSGGYRADLEAYEGMLVKFTDTLTITEQFNLDQFGEIVLTKGARPNSFTVDNDPSAAGYDAHLRDIAARSVYFDDGRSISNPPLANTVVDGAYSSANAPRMGDQVTNLTGVLDMDFNEFRVHAIQNGPGINDFVSVNARPAAPADVGGTLKIASFNVLNYFPTLNAGGALTDNGFAPRGAETAAEFARQTAKLVNVILTLDADVIGLMELENNFKDGDSGNAIQYLVSQLNAASTGTQYDWVRPGVDFLGGDAIAVGMIYDKGAVRISAGTNASILDDNDAAAATRLSQSTVGAIFNGANTSRAALAVTFEEISTGGDFTVVANHFKSKGGTGTGADLDALNGAGSWNLQRTLAAEALRDWIATNPTGSNDPDVIILGDLNAYNKESPIKTLVAAGYTDRAAGDYSYVFDGQKGSLDHILTSASLGSQVTGVTDWHINADEADALDYQLNFNADLTTNERDPAIFSATTLARVSDHDPVVLGLTLTENKPVFTLQILHYYGESGLLGTTTAARMGALIDKFDDQYANTIKIGEGDTYIPGPWLVGGNDPSLNAVPGIGTTALGRPDIAIFNAFGTTVSALGNHEFDLGSPVLQAAIQASGSGASAWVGAQFPLITSNLDFSADSSLRGLADKTLGGTATNSFAGQETSAIKGKIAPYAISTINGEKIGYVGLTTFDLLIKSSPNGTVPKDDGNLSTSDLEEVAVYVQAAVDALTALGVNKIIMVDQLDTIDRNIALAPLVRGIDVMVAGGGHERLGDATDVAVGFNGHTADFLDTYPITLNGADGKTTLLVTTDTEFTYLGRLVVDFDSNGDIVTSSLNSAINGAYASTEANLQAAYNTTQTADQIVASSAIGAKVDAITDAIQAVIAAKDGTLWGYTKVYLEGDRAFGRAQEVNLGDITADANLYVAKLATGATFMTSLKNGGGLRASIGSIDKDGAKIAPIANPDVGKPAGAISTLDIENALRFDNKLMVFDTTAAGLKAIMEFSAGLSPNGITQSGGFMQIGGIKVAFNATAPAGSRVQSLALIDADGKVIAKVVDNGVVLADAPTTISMISLNFTANGGDGYPIKANAFNFRYLLADGTVSAAIANTTVDFTTDAGFAAAGTTAAAVLGEQKAFQSYLQQFYATPETAFGSADTPAAQDLRIQNLSVSGTADSVFQGLAINGTDNPDHLNGTVLDDTLTGLGGDDVILAQDGDDRVDAGDGNDVVYGGTGFDTLLGGLGNDQLIGEAGNDSILAGEGNDFASGGDGSDTVGGEAGDDYLVGGGGADSLSGGAGQDQLIGEAGNDTVTGGEGSDVVLGGEGDDSITGDADADYLFGGIGNDSLSGGANDDQILGEVGNDQLAGGDGNDILLGGDGDDSLSGDVGTDYLFGGIGNDSLAGGIDGDQLFGEAGNDTLIGGDANDILLGGDSDDSLSGDAGTDYLFGDAGNDSLAGGDGADVILGGEGNDSVAGDGADDFLFGGIGNDSLAGGASNDQLLGEVGNDLLAGGDGNDILLGGDDNDSLGGDAGDDYLFGGIGNDSLAGGADNDQLIGEAGSDTLAGGEGNDIALGGDGDDSINGDAGTDYLFGGIGNDSLSGGDGDDQVFGEAGNDMLFGGAGNNIMLGGIGDDTITGGDGIDYMTGGAGNDAFVWSSLTSATDQIADFTAGSDKLLFSAAGFEGGLVAGGDASGRFALGAAFAPVGTFIYDQASGNLSWDADGTGSASAASLVVTLAGNPALAASDIQIIA